MCRQYFDKALLPTIDRQLQREVKQADRKAFEDRRAELIELGEWSGDLPTVTLVFGNQYESINQAKTYYKD